MFNIPLTMDHPIFSVTEILKLVLAGRMGEAIEKTNRQYPGLLENNQNLLFMLKCRQFVEMVNGSDMEVCSRKSKGGFSPNFNTSPRPNSPIQTSVIQSTKNFSSKSKQTVNILMYAVINTDKHLRRNVEPRFLSWCMVAQFKYLHSVYKSKLSNQFWYFLKQYFSRYQFLFISDIDSTEMLKWNILFQCHFWSLRR